MRIRPSLPFALVLTTAALLGTSCVLRGPAEVRREIQASTGAEYDRELGLTFGRTGMCLVRWGMKIANKHDGDVPDISLAGVHKMQIGVYEVAPPVPSWSSTCDFSVLGPSGGCSLVNLANQG